MHSGDLKVADKDKPFYIENKKLLRYISCYLFIIYDILLWLGILLIVVAIFHRNQAIYINTFIIYGSFFVFLVLLQIITGGFYRCPNCREKIFAYRGNVLLGDAYFSRIPNQVLFKKRFTCPYCKQKFTLKKPEPDPDEVQK